MKRELVKEIKKIPIENTNISDITDKIISYLNVNEYPIPIVKIARAMNFIIGKQELDDTFSGYIAIGDKIQEKFEKDRLICVNSKDNLGHQRFTIAHELAHFLFDYRGGEYYNTYKTTDVNNSSEKRANKFAANLLMPTKEFKRKYNKLNGDDNRIEKLMGYFEVSRKAINLRIIELDLL